MDISPTGKRSHRKDVYPKLLSKHEHVTDPDSSLDKAMRRHQALDAPGQRASLAHDLQRIKNILSAQGVIAAEKEPAIAKDNSGKPHQTAKDISGKPDQIAYPTKPQREEVHESTELRVALEAAKHWKEVAMQNEGRHASEVQKLTNNFVRSRTELQLRSDELAMQLKRSQEQVQSLRMKLKTYKVDRDAVVARGGKAEELDVPLTHGEQRRIQQLGWQHRHVQVTDKAGSNEDDWEMID